MKYLLRPSAEKDFSRLDSEVQSRVVKKLEFFISSPNPIDFAETLTHRETGQYRFRVGNYRIIFDLEDDVLIILTIRHRREVYR